jgi:inositol-hexakisphosphate/diphosphoinositol-pentakisphosphate 1-kinase
VNGFSFVKTSKKYYMDCANQISKIIMKKLSLSLLNPLADRSLVASISDNTLGVSSSSGDPGPDQERPYRPKEMKSTHKDKWELRSVVAVFRHGDRTPKQKMKMRTTEPCFLKFFEGKPNVKKEVKLKTPREL